MDPLTAANTAFALELFRALSQEDPKANLFFSPFSVSSALAMVFLGTRGSTEAQLAKTLHFDTVKEIHPRFRSLNSDINKHGASHILKVANRLYGEKTYKFLPEFLDSTRKMYGAELASVDFQHASKEARQAINEWVKEQTEGKIPKLLAKGMVDSMTKLVLLNAIYFKGKWQEEFSKEATQKAKFRLNKKNTKKVKMMYQKNKFPLGYIEDLKCQVLELPYQGEELSMVILLPNNIEDGTTGLQKTLHFDTVKEIHPKFQSLNSDINKSGSSYILKVANRLYGEKTYKFLPEFLDSTQRMYGAKLAHMDFQGAPEEARQVINEWVKEQTEGKIPKLLASGMVDSMTKLVLVNAIYFKGKWQEEFPKQATKEATFTMNKKDTKKVKMMYQKNRFPLRYIEDLKCQVLELPYQGKELSMVILLPDDIEDGITGLQKIEKQMTLEKLSEWTNPENMSAKKVKVYLPRFKLEETYSLNSHFAHLGLTQLFDPSQADFSGMSGARNLFISKIVHKSFVEVNEEGTEAAAATPAVKFMKRDREFNCDHPFLFLIRHNASSTILFLGRFTSP